MNYLIKCAVESRPYNVFGYKGKQVRDNLSSVDIGLLVQSILENNSKINYPIVANLGGGRTNSVSILELIAKLNNQYDLRLLYTVKDDPRVGDHIWYISSNKTLQSIFNWSPIVTIDSLITQTVNHYLSFCEF
jgi:CDP-paratose 2-epimerase